MKRLAVLIAVVAIGCSKYEYDTIDEPYWGKVRVRVTKETGKVEYLIPEGQETLPWDTGWVDRYSYEQSQEAQDLKYRRLCLEVAIKGEHYPPETIEKAKQKLASLNSSLQRFSK